MIENTKSCTFPLCTRPASDNGLCFLHGKYHGAKIAPERPKAIAKVSKKRKVINREYRKVVSEKLSKDNRCKINSPVCTGRAQGLNHKQKRSPNNLINSNNLENSCNACNLYCETNVGWAKKNGHFISRFKK